MQIRTARTLMFAAAIVAIATLLAAPAIAAERCNHRLGSHQKLSDSGGAVQQEWTITEMRESTASLPNYIARGQLWEATATVRAVAGTVTPLVPNLHAVAKDGQRYTVLWWVASPEGLSAATMTNGQESTGKVYFDATGPEPTAIVYDNGSGTQLMWCRTDGEMTPTDDCPMGNGMPGECPHCRGRMEITT